MRSYVKLARPPNLRGDSGEWYWRVSPMSLASLYFARVDFGRERTALLNFQKKRRGLLRCSLLLFRRFSRMRNLYLFLIGATVSA